MHRAGVFDLRWILRWNRRRASDVPAMPMVIVHRGLRCWGVLWSMIVRNVHRPSPHQRSPWQGSLARTAPGSKPSERLTAGLHDKTWATSAKTQCGADLRCRRRDGEFLQQHHRLERRFGNHAHALSRWRQVRPCRFDDVHEQDVHGSGPPNRC